jgi:thioester reductase-like protein
MIFLTGATGFLGSYVTAGLLRSTDRRVGLLVRARTSDEAARRLWQSLQLHFDFETFRRFLSDRIDLFPGDVTRPALGLRGEAKDRLIQTAESVIHCAAALNRRSSEACMNVNLRGTLEVVKMAQAVDADHGLRRFSNVSTVAVSGRRRNEVVQEDRAVQWNAPDADPYGQTKKFAEHMVRRLLPEDVVTVFRPSAVIGDSRIAATTQFDMLRAFDLFAKAPMIPFHPNGRIDVVPAGFVAEAIVALHLKDKPAHPVYHLSAGEGSPTYRDILRSLGRSNPVFAPRLLGITDAACRTLSRSPVRWGLAPAATLIHVFLDHLRSNTVFDNSRVTAETGLSPAPFCGYARALLDFARANAFRYPHRPWPEPGQECPPVTIRKKEVA